MVTESATAIVMCDTSLLGRVFSLLNLDSLRIIGVLTNVLGRAEFRHAKGSFPCMPACDVDRLAANHADFCIVVRHDHDDDLLERLAARGFDRSRVLDLDALDLLLHGPGLLSAARAVRSGQFQWRGFLTGLSYYRDGVVESVFDDELVNFAGGSQDLFYDYALAREVLIPAPQRFQYAVIGLAPYSFDYDMARAAQSWRFIKYYSTLRDDHGVTAGLPIPLGRVFDRSLYEEGAQLANDLTQANFPQLLFPKRAERLTLSATLAGRNKASAWRRRSFPATQAMNAEILDRYVDLCRSAGLAVFLTTPPMTRLFRDAYGPERLAEFRARLAPQLAKPGVWFRDFFGEEPYDIDHIYDADHLNTKGAMRFSAELRAWIEQSLAAAAA